MRRSSAFALLILIALGLRLGYVLELRDSPTFDSPLVDAWTYDRAARAVVEEGPGAIEVPYYQPPLYVFFLASVYAGTGGSWLAPRLLQALLGALTVGLTAALAVRGSRGARPAPAARPEGSEAAGGRSPARRRMPIAGWVAGALLALYGPVLYFEGELLPPSLILVLNAAALLLLAGGGRPGRSLLRPGLAGLLLGISAAVRPTSLLIAVAAAIWWMGGSAPRRLRGLALGAVLFIVPILPFTIANRVGGGETIAISSNGGINLWLGNGTDSDSLTAIQPGFAWDRLQVEPLRAGVTTRKGESAYWSGRAWREATADPGAWLAALGRKTLRLVGAWEPPRNSDYQAAAGASRVLSLPLVGFGLVAPLAFLGVVVGARRRRAGGGAPEERRIPGLLIWVLAAVALENLLFFPTGRYRLEAVPALCALAGLGLEGVIRGGRRALTPALAAGLIGIAVIVHVDFLGEREIDRARVSLNQGVAHRRADRIDPAETEFQAALRLAPGDPDAHRWLGELALTRRDPAGAAAHFEAALVGAPDYVRVLLGLAQARRESGNPAACETLYEQALRADPWSADVRLNYGAHLAGEGRYAEARAQFEEGLRIDPGREALRRNLRRLDERIAREAEAGLAGES